MAEKQDTARKDAPRRKRSRGNPAIDLRAARQLLSILAAEHADRPFSRNAGAEALGYTSGTSGMPARKLAALVHFGLLIRRRGAYQVSPLGHQLLSTSDLSEVRRARREAFLNPALFREIVSAYQDDGRLPRYFAEALVENFGIAERARRGVAKIFLASGQFAEILNQDGEFVAPRPKTPHSPAATPSPLDSSQVSHTSETSPGVDGFMPVLLDGQGRRAWLKMPQQIYHEDIAALRRYLDYLEPLAVEKTGVLPFKKTSG